MHNRDFSSRVKRLGLEARYLRLVPRLNEWNRTSISPYHFRVYLKPTLLLRIVFTFTYKTRKNISSQVFLGSSRLRFFLVHLVSGFSWFISSQVFLGSSRLRFFLVHLISGFSWFISSQGFLGFPGSLSECWDGSRQFQFDTTSFSCSPPYLNFKVKSSYSVLM